MLWSAQLSECARYVYSQKSFSFHCWQFHTKCVECWQCWLVSVIAVSLLSVGVLKAQGNNGCLLGKNDNGLVCGKWRKLWGHPALQALFRLICSTVFNCFYRAPRHRNCNQHQRSHREKAKTVLVHGAGTGKLVNFKWHLVEKGDLENDFRALFGHGCHAAEFRTSKFCNGKWGIHESSWIRSWWNTSDTDLRVHTWPSRSIELFKPRRARGQQGKICTEIQGTGIMCSQTNTISAPLNSFTRFSGN